MTKEKLDAIRARVDNARYRHWLGDKEALLNNAMNDLLDLLAEVERLMNERDASRHMLEGICGEFEGTIKHADWVAAGSKGMSVPFHGDFASVAHLPSVISRMRWWAREMRRVITGEDK